eukprot:11162215-Lingulodinium_polyedra.AAC.1
MAIVIAYTMEQIIHLFRDKYTGFTQVLDVRFAPVPFRPESSDDAVAGRVSATGAVVECLWSVHISPFVARA